MSKDSNRLDDILSAAEYLFRSNGYRGTSMSDVSELCKITKPALYHYFASKEDIALAVMERTQNYFDRNVFIHAYNENISCVDRLDLIKYAVDNVFSEYAGGCIFSIFAIEQIDVNTSFVAPINYYFSCWKSAYIHILSGTYEQETAIALSDDFVSDLHGALMMMRVLGHNKSLLRLFDRSKQSLEVLGKKKEEHVSNCSNTLKGTRGGVGVKKRA